MIAASLMSPLRWLLSTFAVVVAAVVSLSGCTDSGANCTSAADCEAGHICVSGGGILVRGGRCLPRGVLDGDVDDRPADVPSDASSLDADCTADSECGCRVDGRAQGVCSQGSPGPDAGCEPPESYQTDETRCDGLDNDCDGSVDEYCAAWAAFVGTDAAERFVDVVSVESGIYALGQTDGSPGRAKPGERDIVLAKYSTTGARKWLRVLGSSEDDFAWALAADGSGHVYLAGEAGGKVADESIDGESDILVAKYDAGGDRQWIGTYGSEKSDVARALTLDARGRPVVGGATRGEFYGHAIQGVNDAFVLRLSETGRVEGAKMLQTDQSEFVLGLAAGAGAKGADAVYASGRTNGDLGGETNSGGADAFLAKFGAGGTRKWVRLLGSSNADYGYAVTTSDIERAGSTVSTIYVAGRAGGSFGGAELTGETDGFLAKFDDTGNRSRVRFVGGADDRNDGDEVVYGLGSKKGSVYLAGRMAGEVFGAPAIGNGDAMAAALEGEAEAWQFGRLYGSAAPDVAFAVAPSAAGGFVLVGMTGGSVFDHSHRGKTDAMLLYVPAP